MIIRHLRYIFFFLSISAFLGLSYTSGLPQEHTIVEKLRNNRPEMFIYPEGFLVYQDYIRTIGGKPVVKDLTTIEATVISIKKTVVCPDKVDISTPEQTGCSVEPYPKDLGVVRIDKIITYLPHSHSERPPMLEIEESDRDEKSGQRRKMVLGRGGSEQLAKSRIVRTNKYPQLHEGQQVQTLFLLTVRPVIIKYASIAQPKAGPELTLSSKDNGQQTIMKQIVSRKKAFKPIPRQGECFVFTTRIGEFPETIEKKLPGLNIGSRFRAKIQYNGVLYVKEYERRREQ